MVWPMQIDPRGVVSWEAEPSSDEEIERVRGLVEG